MKWAHRPVGTTRESGFTLIEMLAVVAIILIIGVLAVGSYKGVRTKRLRAQVVNSLPVLKGFQAFWWERQGTFLYSRPAELATDRIRWVTATPTNCEDRLADTTFQITLADPDIGVTPEGCQWE